MNVRQSDYGILVKHLITYIKTEDSCRHCVCSAQLSKMAFACVEYLFLNSHLEFEVSTFLFQIFKKLSTFTPVDFSDFQFSYPNSFSFLNVFYIIFYISCSIYTIICIFYLRFHAIIHFTSLTHSQQLFLQLLTENPCSY